VLDVGCGRGAVTFPAAEAVGAGGFVEAIDIAPGMVERLRVDAEQRGVGNVAVRVGDAEAPGVAEGSVDAVLASLVLFFLPDLGAALRAYRSALRAGGRLAFTTFGETSATWSAIEQRMASFLPDGHPLREEAGGPQTGPLASQDAIRGALTGAGYTDIVIEEREYPVRYGRARTSSAGRTRPACGRSGARFRLTGGEMPRPRWLRRLTRFVTTTASSRSRFGSC
jgi:SAM-dependent methyltransferase